MRYVGQRHEIEVPIPGGRLDKVSLIHMKREYDEQYVKLFARVNPDAKIEALNWRVVVSGPEPEFRMETGGGDTKRTVENARKGERRAYFPQLGGYTACPVYDRYRMAARHQIPGPAIVEERESTLVLGPDCRAEVDDYLNLVTYLDPT
jgi:N-methylhydantoinase A